MKSQIKQEAERLAEAFYNEDIRRFIGVKEAHRDSKQCALIAVEEIIANDPKSRWIGKELYHGKVYWEAVKEEIEEL